MGIAVTSICGCGMREERFPRVRNKVQPLRDSNLEGTRPGELPWHLELGVTMWSEL